MSVRERKNLGFQNLLTRGCTFGSHRKKPQITDRFSPLLFGQCSRLQMWDFLISQKILNLLFVWVTRDILVWFSLLLYKLYYLGKPPLFNFNGRYVFSDIFMKLCPLRGQAFVKNFVEVLECSWRINSALWKLFQTATPFSPLLHWFGGPNSFGEPIFKTVYVKREFKLFCGREYFQRVLVIHKENWGGTGRTVMHSFNLFIKYH